MSKKRVNINLDEELHFEADMKVYKETGKKNQFSRLVSGLLQMYVDGDVALEEIQEKLD